MATPANDLNIQIPGFVTFNGVATFNGRTLTAGTGISISNGNGVSGNPIISTSVTSINTINGDVGFISGPIVTIFAGQSTLNCGSSIFFDNSGTISTLNVTDTSFNTIIGNSSGSANLITQGGNNVGLGASILTSITGQATNSVAIGNSALNIGSMVQGCVAIGNGALASATSASNCLALGITAGGLLLTGAENILLGSNTGINYTSSESNNILIGNAGVITENGAIRIGDDSNQSTSFMAGITGVTAAGSPIAVSSTGQMSDLGFGTATQVLTSNGAGVSPTWQAAGGGGSSTYFQAYRTTNQTVAGGNTSTTIIFDTAITNVGGSYNTANGVFTAPSTGYYAFSSTVNFSNLTTPVGLTQVILAYTGNVQSLRLEQFGLVPATTGAALICTASWFMPMTVGDTVQMQPFADGAGNYIIAGGALSSGAFNTSSTFSGFKVA